MEAAGSSSVEKFSKEGKFYLKAGQHEKMDVAM